MGGFIIALAMEKWMLHRRVALKIVAAIGGNARRIILGFMIATAVLSMWISNTATTLMMLPIALSVIKLIPKSDNGKHERRFAINLLLGIAYAANCGGIATLVGTPPNVAMAGILSETFQTDIGFGTWLLLGLPFSMILLFIVYLMLTHVLNPIVGRSDAATQRSIEEARDALGNSSTAEKRIMFVFVTTALLWICKDLLNSFQSLVILNDSSISMIGGLSLFVARNGDGKPLLDWEDTARLPWGILMLFGGGMALANALKASGLIDIIANHFADSATMGVLTITISLVLVSLILTELISNLALVLVFVPVVGAIAQGMGLEPLSFAVPVTLAASCAFMLPMATPPNAIVFASGEITIAKMMRSGITLNLLAALLAVLFCRFVLPYWMVLV